MSKSKHAAVKRRRLRSFNRHVRWQKVNQTHSSAPPPCTHKHTLANTWKTAAVHFHTESKQPFCLEPPSGSETLCCHCSSVKRRRAELWLSAPCHCMCVQLHRGPGAWVSIPAAPAPSSLTTTHSTRESGSRSRLWPYAALLLSHVTRASKYLTHIRPCTLFPRPSVSFLFSPFSIIFRGVHSIKCPALSRISQ